MGILDAPSIPKDATGRRLASFKVADQAAVAPGVRVTNPYALVPFTAGLSDVLNRIVNISIFGDSITFGVGSDGSGTASTGSTVEATYRSTGFVGQLQKRFATSYGDTGQGAIMPGTTDGRLTLAGGAIINASTGPQEAAVQLPSATATATFIFDMTRAGTVDIYWWDGNRGSFTWSLNGGAQTGTAAVGSNNTGSNVTFNKTTITGVPAGTAQTLLLTGTASGSNIIAAVVPNSGTAGVQVHRFARSGNTSGNLIGNDSTLNGNTSGQARMIQAGLRAPVADLAIVALGVNDFGGQNTTDPATNQKPGATPTQYAANLQTFITAAAGRSVPVLLLGEPRVPTANYPAPATYPEQAYYDAAKQLALSNSNTAFADLADLWGTQVQGSARGYYTSGSVHPTRQGHGSMAQLLHRVLTTPWGEQAATV